MLIGVSLSLILAALATSVNAEEPTPLISQTIWREAEPTASETELDRLNRELVDLANRSRPAVVQIRAPALEAKGSQGRSQGIRGSGFIIDPKGYILTAHHVVDRAVEVEARLADGQRLPAQIVAADSHLDIALLKVQTDQELPILSFGDSSQLRVGDLALVFGYPFGRESSMNMGIISRPGRTYTESASYDYIQTDAGAYAGGSGGPLLNSKGHVIGMITMASERGNMGFATPINVIKRVLPRLVNGEKLAWGWLGVRMADVSLEQAKTLGLPRAKGVLVSAVLPDQSAAIGGLRKQDIILSVNDKQVESPRDVARMVGGIEAGKVVRLTILRNGQTIQLAVPLTAKPGSAKDREG